MSAAETWRLNAGDETRVMDGRNNPVCDVKCGGMSGRTVAEGEKIARLIAAAHALLEAASRLIGSFDELRSMTTAERIITGRSDQQIRQDSNKAIADLRAAIALAKGEAK